MLQHGGFITGRSKPSIDGMIDIVKGVERETGYTSILKVSEIEAKMRETRIRRTKTVCTYCGVGCSFDIWTKDRHILKVEPADGPANGVSTCIKGKFAWDFVNSQDRLTTPLIREGDRFREAGWDEALDPGRWDTAVIPVRSRTSKMPHLVVIIVSNTTLSHPVLATRVKRAHKLHGQKLIVSDLREHEMARRADVLLHPQPGTDLVWLSAVSRYLLDNKLAATTFLDRWVNNLQQYRKILEPFTLEFAKRPA